MASVAVCPLPRAALLIARVLPSASAASPAPRAAQPMSHRGLQLGAHRPSDYRHSPAFRGSLGVRDRSAPSLVCRATKDEGEEEEADKGPVESEEHAPSDFKVSSEEFRQRMEALVETQGKDEAFFDGRELAKIIFSKFGRSYDVTFIRQEFMGRKLLALNVMWKYREQKSFPLTEEEYLYRLDRVAENLRFWGAVGLVRESLAATKERPRIGKAVSIRIDLDESGERSREWINR